MKAIKTLLAVSVLAAAGAANAATVATWTNDVAMTGSTSFTSTTGTESAVLDSAGTLTITAPSETTMFFGNPAVISNITYVFSGNLVGSTFTVTGGTVQKLGGCTGAAAATVCGPLVFPTLDTLAASGVITVGAGGTINSSFTAFGVVSSLTHTMGAADAPAVPVPAAAWLFGSGLLGLAGTARRRRNA